MDASKITTATRKALIAADSVCFSWTAPQQETFRAMGEAPCNQADRVLLTELPGIRAVGLERQLDELKSCWYQYTQECWQELSRQSTQSDPAAYMEDNSEDNELHRNVIFNNESALKQIRWRYFLSDCEVTKADFAAISDLEQPELTHAKTWLQTTHQDIMQNFDPNVIKLKKKRKVVIAPGAFDGIGRGDSEE